MYKTDKGLAAFMFAAMFPYGWVLIESIDLQLINEVLWAALVIGFMLCYIMMNVIEGLQDLYSGSLNAPKPPGIMHQQARGRDQSSIVRGLPVRIR